MYKVGGYLLTLEEVHDWAKRYGQNPRFPLIGWVDQKLEDLEMSDDLWTIVTDWPRGNSNREGTAVVMLARGGRKDPRATLAYYTRFSEGEHDLKVKRQLEEQGLRPVWCTIPDPHMRF